MKNQKSFKVPVAPSVLIWARESMGLSIAEAAKKINVSQQTLKQWEEKNIQPTFAEVEKLAKVYERPLAVFLLDAPPEESALPKDFRTQQSEKPKPLTSKTLLAIRKARRLQFSAIELYKELGLSVRPFSERTHLEDNPEIVAQRIRSKIIPTGFSVSMFEKCEDAFESWKTILENNGVLVFQISITQSEIHGFAFTDGDLPVIVVNKRNETHSKIFSLFHELGHIALNVGGICDMKNETHSPIVEKFCNHFAGALLVPETLLLHNAIVRNNTGNFVWKNSDLKYLANVFKVSKEVILRRLLTFQKTTQAFYKKWREENVKEYKPFGKGGINVPKVRIEERGKKYVSMVFDAYARGKINTLDVVQFLDVKVNHIPKVQEYLS